MVLPGDILHWVNGLYPRPLVKEDWLEGCFEWVVSQGFDDQPLNIDKQILASDLRASMQPETGLPPEVLAAKRHVLRANEATLVMIMSVMEISHSAFNLQNTRQTRIERTDMGDEEARIQMEEDEGPIPSYPGGMLEFILSDGYTDFKAIEYRPLPMFKLGETKLGTKVGLKGGVLFRNGIAFLESKTIRVYPESHVKDLDSHQDRRFVRTLRVRLGQPDDGEEDEEDEQEENGDDEPRQEAPTRSLSPIDRSNAPSPPPRHPIPTPAPSSTGSFAQPSQTVKSIPSTLHQSSYFATMPNTTSHRIAASQIASTSRARGLAAEMRISPVRTAHPDTTVPDDLDEWDKLNQAQDDEDQEMWDLLDEQENARPVVPESQTRASSIKTYPSSFDDEMFSDIDSETLRQIEEAEKKAFMTDDAPPTSSSSSNPMPSSSLSGSSSTRSSGPVYEISDSESDSAKKKPSVSTRQPQLNSRAAKGKTKQPIILSEDVIEISD